jgi:hypothetical protein
MREFSSIFAKQREILGGHTNDDIKKSKMKLEEKASQNIIHYVEKDEEKEKEEKKKDLFKPKNVKKQEEDNNVIKVKCPPSGSNFNIFSPSIGVNIKERNKIKVGGVEYLKKFNKYSVNEYNQAMKDVFDLEKNQKKNSNFLNNLTNLNNFRNLNLEGEKKVFELDKKKSVGKTFYIEHDYTNNITNKRKTIYKSKSDINIVSEKNDGLKRILMQNDESNLDKKKKIIKYSSDVDIINYNKIPFQKTFNINLQKKKYELIDNFNKNLLNGNLLNYNRNTPVLPRLPPKKNLIFGNSTFGQTTTNMFYRTRQKRVNLKLFTDTYFNSERNFNKKKKELKSEEKEKK